jgi:hypothetical protein
LGEKELASSREERAAKLPNWSTRETEQRGARHQGDLRAFAPRHWRRKENGWAGRWPRKKELRPAEMEVDAALRRGGRRRWVRGVPVRELRELGDGAGEKLRTLGRWSSRMTAPWTSAREEFGHGDELGKMGRREEGPRAQGTRRRRGYKKKNQGGRIFSHGLRSENITRPGDGR